MIDLMQQGSALILTLNAPVTRNALSDAMVQVLSEALAQAVQIEDLRAVVLRGAGGHFCAGGDFSGFKRLIAVPRPEVGPDPIAVANRRFGALLEQLAACPVPTIAVVEGAAIGGGVGLAAACTVVLASDTAGFGMPEVTLGLPPAQIAPFVANRIGAGPALRLMLTGRRISAAEAMALGLCDEMLTGDHLDARLQHWLKLLQKAEPQCLRHTLQIVRSAAGRGATLDRAAELFALALRSGTAAEGLAAFSAKRSPLWALEADKP
ncbi:enoyl-CoA hydratase/isomerase family protein [Roseateles toxinivorans]|uniref:Isohexenylglutaconyl-CoA hydratase n=1 Tax=Roseateles toxinivorans TaxID=270368 RepID=A0A4R6QAA6_9BURK|nr:enoyl-CoA hydratase-related protein [Roseateles toxinivorans]TDP59574.1 isohexenylglutaconyl-CoA hydratase [Roseateles toxinivorans]